MDHETKTLIQDLGEAFDEYKRTNDSRLKAVEKAKGTAELDEKLERIDESLTSFTEAKDAIDTKLKVQQERIDELEAELESGGPAGSKSAIEKMEAEYAKKFDAWARSCREDGSWDHELAAEVRKAEKATLEAKDIATTTGAAGGFAVPEQIGRQIHDQVRLLSPMRDICRVVTIGTSDYKELVNIHGENSAWVGETGTRNQGTTPAFRERAPTMGTLYTYPRATEESVDDVFFNVGQLLVDVSSTEFAIAESTAFLNGSGTNRPTGILNTSPVATDDDASPARSAEAIEDVALDLSSPVSAIDPDQLITLYYLLRAPYRMGANWAMNSSTVAAIRKLKGSDNNYLWQPGLQAGTPATLLGSPIRVLEAMADPTDVSPDSYPILWGNFNRGYLIVDRVGVRITVDNNITTPGYINWYIRKRVGGILLDNNALKAGRFGT